MTSLQEIASDVLWLPYNSKVVPIDFMKNKARDQRVYLMLTISEDEAILFNKANRRIGFMTVDEIADFNDSFSTFKIKTEAPVGAPDDPSIIGVGHYFDAGKGD
jgi:hypothetical protein